MKLRVGFDLDDTIFGFSEGYLKRFKHFPKYDWAITRNVQNILIKDLGESFVSSENHLTEASYYKKIEISKEKNPKIRVLFLFKFFVFKMYYITFL